MYIPLVLVPFAKYVDCCWLMMTMDAVLEDLGIAQQATSVVFFVFNVDYWLQAALRTSGFKSMLSHIEIMSLCAPSLGILGLGFIFELFPL